jgi:hypothetical protein
MHRPLDNNVRWPGPDKRFRQADVRFMLVVDALASASTIGSLHVLSRIIQQLARLTFSTGLRFLFYMPASCETLSFDALLQFPLLPFPLELLLLALASDSGGLERQSVLVIAIDLERAPNLPKRIGPFAFGDTVARESQQSFYLEAPAISFLRAGCGWYCWSVEMASSTLPASNCRRAWSTNA